MLRQVLQEEEQADNTVVQGIYKLPWRKGNPLTLLVGRQTSTATMENSVEIP